jgi:hypothetical protein
MTAVQSADVIWIADGWRPVQRLARFALDNWTIGPAEFSQGPFRPLNYDRETKLRVSDIEGTITLEASADLFEASHIGTLMQIMPTDYSGIPLWKGNTNVNVATGSTLSGSARLRARIEDDLPAGANAAGSASEILMRYGKNIYQLIAGTNTGLTPPLHTEGDELVDHEHGTTWRYISDDMGIMRITAVAGPREATAEVIRTIPPPCMDDWTWRWAEGAWNTRHGWPAVLEIFDQRLVAAASTSEPRTLWFSAIGDFLDFRPGIEADDSFAYAIAGDESLNRILWLRRGKSGLHIGALGEEYSTRSDTRNQAIGPTTAYFGQDSSIGSIEARPVAPEGNPIFISRDGARVFEIRYVFEIDGNRAQELSLPSSHLGAPGFLEAAWQSAPQRLAWFRRGDGSLAVLLHDTSEDVLGWAPLTVAGGHVEAMAVVPDATGRQDVLTLIVRRQVGAVMRRFVEELAMPYAVLDPALPVQEACHLYGGARFAPAGPQATFALPWLAGAEVHAWTDLGGFGPLPVAADGTVELPEPVTAAVIGLHDASHLMETLDVQAAANDGSTIGRRKRLASGLHVVLHRAAGGHVAVVERDLGGERVTPFVPLLDRPVASPVQGGITGVVTPRLPTGHGRALAVRIRPEGGAPLTVLGIVPPVQEVGA